MLKPFSEELFARKSISLACTSIGYTIQKYVAHDSDSSMSRGSNHHTEDLQNGTMLELYVFPGYNMRDSYQVSVSVKRRLHTESFS